FHTPPPTDTYTLSLHDALPIWRAISSSRSYSARCCPSLRMALARTIRLNLSEASSLPGLKSGWFALAALRNAALRPSASSSGSRSEEHTSELQSRRDLVCRLLL